MKPFLLVGITILILLPLTVVQPAEAAPPSSRIGAQGSVLCPPGIYLETPGDCLPLGPSAYLTEMARQGFTFPLQPLPAMKLDPALAELPYYYAKLKEEPTPVYANLDDAVSERSPIRTIEAGALNYVTYVDFAETSNGRFFLLKGGGWVRVASRVSPPRNFMGGLTFSRTPHNSFGWIMPFSSDTQSKRTPGYQANDYTGRSFSQYEVVQIYSVQLVGDKDWYQIGPDEWIEQRIVGRVVPNTTPPKGVTNGRWIEVNLFEQTLAVYDQNQLVFATLIASGVPPFHTRPGLFPVYKKLESTTMSGSFELDRSDFYYLENVPYTLYYDEARALHGAYWRSYMGYKQSHGCVNLSISDAHWLFNWANEGDWVYVWDPSGETPVDPSLYSEGGA